MACVFGSLMVLGEVDLNQHGLRGKCRAMPSAGRQPYDGSRRQRDLPCIALQSATSSGDQQKLLMIVAMASCGMAGWYLHLAQGRAFANEWRRGGSGRYVPMRKLYLRHDMLLDGPRVET